MIPTRPAGPSTVQRIQTPEPAGAAAAAAVVEERNAPVVIDVASGLRARVQTIRPGLQPADFRQQFFNCFHAIASSIADDATLSPEQKVGQFISLELAGQEIGAGFTGTEYRLGARSAMNEVIAELIEPVMGGLDPDYEHWTAVRDARARETAGRAAGKPDALELLLIDYEISQITHSPPEDFFSVTNAVQRALDQIKTMSIHGNCRESCIRLAEALVVRDHRKPDLDTKACLASIIETMKTRLGLSEDELGFAVNAALKIRGPEDTDGMVRELSNAFNFLKAQAKSQDLGTYCEHLLHLEHSAWELGQRWEDDASKVSSVQVMADVVEEIRSERLWIRNNPEAAPFLIACRQLLDSPMGREEFENAIREAYKSTSDAIVMAAASARDSRAKKAALAEACAKLRSEAKGERLESFDSVLPGLLSPSNAVSQQVPDVARKTPQAIADKLAELNRRASNLDKKLPVSEYGGALVTIAQEVSALVGEFPINDLIAKSEMYCQAATTIRAARRTPADQALAEQAIKTLRDSMLLQKIPTDKFDGLMGPGPSPAALNQARIQQLENLVPNLKEAAKQSTAELRSQARIRVINSVVDLIRSSDGLSSQKFDELSEVLKKLDEAYTTISGVERVIALEEGFVEMSPVLQDLDLMDVERKLFHTRWAAALTRASN